MNLYNSRLKEFEYHTYFSSKAKSSEAAAKLIGAPQIITSSRYICLQYGGKVRVGLSMDSAEGVPVSSVSKECVKVLPSFQRELIILSLLDVICFQKDHAPYNYFVKLDKTGGVIGLQAFDNDYGQAFTARVRISFMTQQKESPFVLASGYVNRPYLDRETAERVMSLTRDEIYRALSPHISRLEVLAAWVRVKRLANAIRKSLEAGTVTLLEKEQWTYATMTEELSGKYGKTYLVNFFERYNAVTEK